MLAMYRSGRQADALAHYQDIRGQLASELGIDPSPALQWLHQQILTADPLLTAAVTSAAPGRAEPAGPPQLAGRYSLPPGTAAFTGRDSELGRITAAVTDAARDGGVVAIHAIGGMPGIGKTALAVQVARLLRDRFCDRQLFIDLHAHTPGQDPVTPQEALAGLLVAAGVDARFLPEDLEPV
jgi:Bacterial transcriptional activator domain